MSLVLQSSGGGSVTINEPTTSSNFTQSLPAATGTVMVSGNQPAFSAYMGSVIFNHNTDTKIPWSSELFDTNNCYNTSTYTFTPNVAGYYYVTCVMRIGGGSGRQYDNTLTIKKNGTTAIYIENSFAMGSGQVSNLSCSGIVYLNGSTDYLDSYFNPYDYTASSTVTVYGGNSIFQACLIRGA